MMFQSLGTKVCEFSNYPITLNLYSYFMLYNPVLILFTFFHFKFKYIKAKRKRDEKALL